MMDLRMVAIAGTRGPRTPMFSGGAKDMFSMGNYYLGASGQDLYNQSKQYVAEYDQLADRIKRIANQTAREDLIKEYGLNDPSNKDKAQYMRDANASSIAQVEGYSPPNYIVFEAKGPAPGRPAKLADFLADMRPAISEAERTYGVLPQPVTITQYVTTPGQIPWIPIAVVGTVAVAGLVALGVIKFK